IFYSFLPVRRSGNPVEHSLTFDYDGLSQLTAADIGNIGSGTWQGDYVYYKNGDMTSRTINSVTDDSFDYTGNEMTTIDGLTLTYDENGNLTAGLKDASTPVTLEYNWDNKLRKAIVEQGTANEETIELRYDPAGNRIAKDSTIAGDSKYIVDVVGDLPTILLEMDPTDLSIAKSYIYANSQILAEHNGGLTDDKYFYLHDRLGSVRQVIDSEGYVVKMFTFDPFGQTLEDQGSFYTPWQFTGQYLDGETNLYYLRARQYSPYLGRFTGWDLVLGDFERPLTLHKYSYCQNNPINLVDLNGLWAFYITGTFSMQFLRAGCWQAGIVIDGEGNVGLITIMSEDVGSPQLSCGISFGYSYNAETIYDLAGYGSEAAGGSLPSLGFEKFWNDDGVWGVEGTIGPVLLPIPEFHYYTRVNTTVKGTRWGELGDFRPIHDDSIFAIHTLRDFYIWGFFGSILDDIYAGRPPKIQME
ncbi:MAG: RHS repeat-associated core domain-containing protein, partial [Sedimentisphaerales bacterium]|nr:RHS repeat-associated core domain-containing protein [Sedimentisphaerales bacterium]